MAYTGEVCTASLPAPSGKENRASMASIDRITQLDMRSSPLASIAQLGTAAYRQNAAGNKPRPLREQKHSGIRDDTAGGAGAEGMNLVEVLANAARVGLLGAPLFEHWRPNAGRAYGIHANFLRS